MSATYWANYDRCLNRVSEARTVDGLIDILNEHYAPSSGEAFFPGGAERTFIDALDDAGWRFVWVRADYFFAAIEPEGSNGITFIEGDVVRGIAAAGLPENRDD